MKTKKAKQNIVSAGCRLPLHPSIQPFSQSHIVKQATKQRTNDQLLMDRRTIDYECVTQPE